MDEKTTLDRIVEAHKKIDKEASEMALSGDVDGAQKHRKHSVGVLTGLITKLNKAKAAINKGELEGVFVELQNTLDLLSQNVGGSCVECGATSVIVQKNDKEYTQCVGCNALSIKKNTYNNMLKYSQEEITNMESKKYTKKELVAHMWDLWRKADEDITAFDINTFEASGKLKKSIVDKLGLEYPSETLSKNQELDKGIVEIGKDEILSKSDILDLFLQIVKNKEHTQRINRHTLAKFEATGQIDEDVLEVLYKKAGKDFLSLKKKLKPGSGSIETIKDNAPLRHKAARMARIKENAAKLTPKQTESLASDFGPGGPGHVPKIKKEDEDSKKIWEMSKKAKWKMSKEKGESDFLDDKKEHISQKRGPLKPIVLKKKKK